MFSKQSTLKSNPSITTFYYHLILYVKEMLQILDGEDITY